MGGGISCSLYPLVFPCGKRRSLHRKPSGSKNTCSLRYGGVALALSTLLPDGVASWNSFATQSQLYTFQEFYSDAQYGPDFGYYSTGQILHSDGPADNGASEADAEGAAGQDWFNSYTTIPMLLSPHFAQALCDRVVTMWQALGSPDPFIIVEFGGGTGMLARDFLRRGRDTDALFYNALAKYVIAERSPALRGAQKHTTAEFRVEEKLEVAAVDAREAAALRPRLDEIMGGRSVVGIILSNELLDEMDPVRLRFMWRLGQAPSVRNSADCRLFREAYVLHRIDTRTIETLLQAAVTSNIEVDPEDIRPTVQSISWEGNSLTCGLLNTPPLARAIEVVAEDLSAEERTLCSPMLVCCLPFLLAVNQALMYSDTALESSQLLHRDESGTTDLGGLYKHHLLRLNGTALLSKERYRQLRRLVAELGPEVENAFLLGDGSSVLPGRVHSEEVFLALSPSRCRELKGWMTRHAERLAAAAHLHDRTEWVFNGHSPGRTSMHLKLVARPGEAQFVEQTSRLLDSGFMTTMDYGADADALLWHALVRPNFEGIFVMDARRELAELCADSSYLECPGLQDLTTSVDFTEVAEAGKMLGGWSVLAYGPIFLLELSFSQALSDPLVANPLALGHLLERAGGLSTEGMQGWYLKPEQESWASFKILVQHRGEIGSHWSLGPLGKEWPLSSTRHLFHSPSPCWDLDLTKPPLSASIVAIANERVKNDHSGNLSETDAVMQSFEKVLLRNDSPDFSLSMSIREQKRRYIDIHMAQLIMDYLVLLITDEECQFPINDNLITEVHKLASSRRLPELYGQEEFERVMSNLRESVLSNGIPFHGSASYPPYVCLAEHSLLSRCQGLAKRQVMHVSDANSSKLGVGIESTYLAIHDHPRPDEINILEAPTSDNVNDMSADWVAITDNGSNSVEDSSTVDEDVVANLEATIQAQDSHAAMRLSL